MQPGQAAPLVCDQCGDVLKATKFRDGTEWTIDQLVTYSQRKFERTFCMNCYRGANKIRKIQKSRGAQQRTPWAMLTEIQGYITTLRRAEEAIAEGRALGTGLTPEAVEHGIALLDQVYARIEKIKTAADPVEIAIPSVVLAPLE